MTERTPTKPSRAFLMLCGLIAIGWIAALAIIFWGAAGA